LESWLIEHIVIPGGPENPGAWDKLTAILGRTWTHESGAVMQLSKLAIDTGYEAPAVYAWSRAVGTTQVAPIKGVETFNRATPVSGPTFVDATIGGKRLRRGARLWTIAVSTFKAETYRFLRLERPSDEDRALGVCDAPGTVHLPSWVDSEWLKQLVAEQMVTVRNKRGYGHLEWQKMRERNEALDCRVYARAAAWILGADRWDEATWRSLESQAGVEKKPKAVAIPAAEAPEPQTPSAPTAGAVLTPRRRRTGAVTPSYLRK
ncbi:MAG: phage terminase large subunit family protein, partial [Rhodobacteraceae bacterium]|nr:phage terminase large subunit family protein [Paracoccaceae bacterium]